MMINAGQRSISEALDSVKSEEVKAVISSELASLEANNTFEFVNTLARKLITRHMILQKKLNELGNIECYKAILVVHSFRQWTEINWDKTPEPLVSIAAVRLTYETPRRSRVNKELYIILPKGIILLKGRLRVGSCSEVPTRLLKCLYILKQVTVNWFETLDHFLTSSGGIQKLKAGPETYVLRGADTQITKALLVSDDDMILFGDSIRSVKRSLRQHFQIKTLRNLD